MRCSVLWIQTVFVFCMVEATHGLQCLSCQNVLRPTACHNATTCAEGSICYMDETLIFGNYVSDEFGCRPTLNCPRKSSSYVGFAELRTLECCDNGDLCNLKLTGSGHAPTATPTEITHIDPPFIAGKTFLELHSTEYLYCWYNASKPLSTTWLFNGGSTLPPHASADGSLILSIKNMTRSEVGNYTCIISINGLEAKTSVFINLLEANTPIGRPVLNAHPLITNGHMLVDYQSAVSLHCASQRNDVTFTWLFNGTSTLPQHARLTDHTITIEHVNVTEVGKYTCIISKNGYASPISVWVSIKEEKAHVSSITSSPAHRPMANQQFNVFCNVTGFPDPTIRWSFKDPMGLYYVPPDTTFPRHNVIHVEHFQPSLHSGTWTCMVRNSLGADQKSLDI